MSSIIVKNSTQKGSSTVAEYISKIKSLADEMTSAGTKLDDEELCSYIQAGLDYEYNSLVSSVAARVEPITLGELYSQLLAYETHLDLQGGGQAPGGQMQSSVNTASRGRGGFMRGRGGHNSRGGSNSGGRGRGDSFNKSKNRFPPCQLCGRTNHPIFKCYKRFDPTYMGEEKTQQIPHNPMVWILIGMQTLELPIMLLEILTSLP
jgi:hypothetical protein